MKLTKISNRKSLKIKKLLQNKMKMKVSKLFKNNKK